MTTFKLLVAFCLIAVCSANVMSQQWDGNRTMRVNIQPAPFRPTPYMHSTYISPVPPMPVQRFVPSAYISAVDPAQVAAMQEQQRQRECLIQAATIHGYAGERSLATPFYYRGCVDRNPYLQGFGSNLATAISAGDKYSQLQNRPIQVYGRR